MLGLVKVCHLLRHTHHPAHVTDIYEAADVGVLVYISSRGDRVGGQARGLQAARIVGLTEYALLRQNSPALLQTCAGHSSTLVLVRSITQVQGLQAAAMCSLTKVRHILHMHFGLLPRTCTAFGMLGPRLYACPACCA